MLSSTVSGEALAPRFAARLKKKVAARARAAKARAGKRKADLGDPAAAAASKRARTSQRRGASRADVRALSEAAQLRQRAAAQEAAHGASRDQTGWFRCHSLA